LDIRRWRARLTAAGTISISLGLAAAAVTGAAPAQAQLTTQQNQVPSAVPSAITPNLDGGVSYLTVSLTGHHNFNGGGANGALGGRAMDISPDGTKAVIVGNFKNADGVVHDQVVMLDLGATSASVDADWNTGEFTAACASGAFDSYVEDVSFAPSGSYFAIVATGGGGFAQNTDGTRALCDSASRWATSDIGANVMPTWVDYTGNDSFWSVAVTGTAITPAATSAG